MLTPDPQARSETLNAENWRFSDPLRPQSNTNLKVTADANSAVATKPKDSANLKIGICQRYHCFAAVLSLELHLKMRKAFDNRSCVQTSLSKQISNVLCNYE